MQIRFDTTDYINSHAKAPKGKGNWAFDITWSNGRGGHEAGSFYYSGKLADAKRAAKEYAKANGFGATQAKIFVCA